MRIGRWCRDDPKMNDDSAQSSLSKQSCQSRLKDRRQLSQANEDSEHLLEAGRKIELSC